MNPISNALTQGFSNENILQYLLRHFPHARKQIEQALSKGYTAEKIVKFLQGGRKEVNQPITEHEQARASHKEKQQNLEKNIGHGALALGATGLGAYALSRALPKGAQVLQGELLPALNEIGMQGRPQLPAPGQATIQPPFNPNGPGQGPLSYSNPTAQGIPSKSIPPSPIPTQTSMPEKAPIETKVTQVVPLPEALHNQVSNLLHAGNNIEDVSGQIKKLQPQIVKEYEKATNTPIRSAIEEFSKSLPPKEKTQPMGAGVQEEQNPIQGKVSESSPILEEEKVPNLGNIAKGMMENFYEGIFKSLQEGKDTFSGIKDPLIAKAKPFFEKGLIKSPEDLKEFANNPDKFKERKKVALPNGDIGEITNIRQGIATVNSNGKEYRRKLDELIESPIPEKELADLYNDLKNGIKKETGQEISKAINYIGFSPEKKSLVVHYASPGADTYVFNDLSENRINELVGLQQLRRTSGENYIGAWEEGTKSVFGSKMHDLVKELENERGGKGKAHEFTYKTLYDALEPAKVASHTKFKEKEKAKSAEKKAEKEKTKKEKENDKKRKAKKPRPD